MNLSTKTFQSIDEIKVESWNELNSSENPFLKYEFLSALEKSGSVSVENGWLVSHYGWLNSDNEIIAILPLYIKNHSYGEYMFDWDWANSIHQAGMKYYPKGVSAIPFTPVPGGRLLTREDNGEQITSELVKQLLTTVDQQGLSNLQCLFLEKEESKHWSSAGAIIRSGYQFTWYNREYDAFDDFLSSLRSSARKKINRERKLLSEKGISFSQYHKDEISDELLDFFYLCYQKTYMKRSGHGGYLNRDFFQLLRKNMADDLLLVCATYDNKPIASALFIKGKSILYGRYWGAMEEIDGLHFECCYYQAIDYCIKNEINCFQPGTQGDYKRRRGFKPEFVYGAYYFPDSGLQQSIQHYVTEEAHYLERLFSKWKDSDPYKLKL